MRLVRDSNAYKYSSGFLFHKVYSLNRHKSVFFTLAQIRTCVQVSFFFSFRLQC